MIVHGHRQYAKMVAEQWPAYREEYVENANIINKAENAPTKVPIALSHHVNVVGLFHLLVPVCWPLFCDHFCVLYGVSLQNGCDPQLKEVSKPKPCCFSPMQI